MSTNHRVIDDALSGVVDLDDLKLPKNMPNGGLAAAFFEFLA